MNQADQDGELFTIISLSYVSSAIFRNIYIGLK